MIEKKEINIDTLYVYVVKYDDGFAPNYGGVDDNQKICTLACCKPKIRKVIGTKWKNEQEHVNIWIMGVAGSDITKKYNCNKRYNIIYLMEITEVLTFDEYYKKYQFKKPCIKNKIGDNRYNNDFIKKINECKSCKELENDNIYKEILNSNIHNDLNSIKHDISGEYVLLSTNFYHINCHVECGEDIRALVSKSPRVHRKIDRKDICGYIEYLIKNNHINQYHLKIDKDHDLFKQSEKESYGKCS